VGAEAAKLRLKNLIAAARDELTLSPPDADALLAPAEAFLDDEAAWHDVAQGLAIYLSPTHRHVLRVPGPVVELGLVADRFAVAPVLHAVLPDATFHVLTLSRNHTHLFVGDRFTLRSLRVPDLPDSLSDALWYESHENLLNRHGGAHIGSGRPTSTIHGGSASDERKDQFDRYVRKVDDAVVAALSGSKAPLVVAAVDRELAAYAAASRYPHLMPDGIVGNPEHTKLTDLHAAAWALVEKGLLAHDAAACDRFCEFAGTGQTDTDPAAIAELAQQGGIDTLFVAPGARAYDGAVELVNVAASETYRTRGTVVALDDLGVLVPAGATPPIVAALVRPGHR
jgi:hypothetical protein